jgi:hypothetical protein
LRLEVVPLFFSREEADGPFLGGDSLRQCDVQLAPRDLAALYVSSAMRVCRIEPELWNVFGVCAELKLAPGATFRTGNFSADWNIGRTQRCDMLKEGEIGEKWTLIQVRQLMK